jgi:hypothetical protein
MTTQTSTRPRSIWKDRRAIVSSAKPSTRSDQARPSKPAIKTQAEKDADRWVAEMMFDHYNG